MHDLGPFNGNQSNKLLNIIDLSIAKLKLIYWGFWISILARSLGCNFAILLCTCSHRYFEFQEWGRTLLNRSRARVILNFCGSHWLLCFWCCLNFGQNFLLKELLCLGFSSWSGNIVWNMVWYAYTCNFFKLSEIKA